MFQQRPRPQNAKNIHGVTSQWPRARRVRRCFLGFAPLSGCGSAVAGITAAAVVGGGEGDRRLRSVSRAVGTVHAGMVAELMQMPSVESRDPKASIEWMIILVIFCNHGRGVSCAANMAGRESAHLDRQDREHRPRGACGARARKGGTNHASLNTLREGIFGRARKGRAGCVSC